MRFDLLVAAWSHYPAVGNEADTKATRESVGGVAGGCHFHIEGQSRDLDSSAHRRVPKCNRMIPAFVQSAVPSADGTSEKEVHSDPRRTQRCQCAICRPLLAIANPRISRENSGQPSSLRSRRHTRADQPAATRFVCKSVSGEASQANSRSVRTNCPSFGGGPVKTHKYELVIWWSDEDDVFVVDVPELPGCMAHGTTLNDAVSNSQDAISFWLEGARELGRAIPRPSGRRSMPA